MFHLNIIGATETEWMQGYDGGEYSNTVMGEWFLLYRRDVKIYLLFVNHPVHPV